MFRLPYVSLIQFCLLFSLLPPISMFLFYFYFSYFPLFISVLSVFYSFFPLPQSHPEALDIAIGDSSAYSLRAVAKSISSIIILLFALIASRKDGASVTMFLIIIALTACSGISLALTIYSSAIDAIIIAFFIKPDKLRLENPIVFLRFLRTTEAALR